MYFPQDGEVPNLCALAMDHKSSKRPGKVFLFVFYASFDLFETKNAAYKISVLSNIVRTRIFYRKWVKFRMGRLL